MKRARLASARCLAFALCFAAPALAQAPIEIWSPLPESAVRAALRELGGEGFRFQSVAARGLGDRVKAATEGHLGVLLLGHDALALADTASRGLLDGAPRYPWCDPWLMIAGSRETQEETLPKSIEDLVFDGSRHADYVLAGAETADALWIGWIADLLRSGHDEEYAFTWLRTLEAHALETTASEAMTLDALRSGRARLGIVLRSTWQQDLQSQGRGALREVALRVPLPTRGHGIAIVLGTRKDAALAALVERLCAQPGKQIVANQCLLDIAPPDLAAQIAGPADAERWMTRWLGEEKGKGKFALNLEGWLDLAFFAVFAVFLFYASRRLGRAESESRL